MTSSIKKKHHYIPRFYLEGFCPVGQPSRIYVYEKGSGKVFLSNLNDAGHENHFYSFTTETGEKDTTSIENWFSQIEGNAAPVLRKIKSYAELTDEDRAHFAIFLALMHSRVPTFRRGIERFIAASVKTINDLLVSDKERFARIVKQYEATVGESVGDPEELRTFAVMGEDAYSIEATPESSLSFMDTTKSVVPLLLMRNWRFCCSKEASVATSDNPFIFYNTEHDPKSFYSGHGLLFPATEIFFSIDSKTFLNLSFRKSAGYADAPNQLVEKFNDLVVMWTDRYAYYSQDSAAFADVVKKYPCGAAVQMRTF